MYVFLWVFVWVCVDVFVFWSFYAIIPITSIPFSLLLHDSVRFAF